MIAALADALAALHEQGFLHGDIKPSSIGFTSSGSPKLLDFGLARSKGGAATAGGTLRYVSPEALAGRQAGEADDVWSLCVVLYETVAGRQAFAGGSADEVAGRGVRRGASRGPLEGIGIFSVFLSGFRFPVVSGAVASQIVTLLRRQLNEPGHDQNRTHSHTATPADRHTSTANAPIQ